ncbi:hypothetical protein C6A37_03845 [Desulfobacteraceae bacterium SEEP-SAG9]|nr:hypothetical protein C6A37_03845 [Desulfobacteraceae bacterium SEEP-SAG9]
MAYDSILTRRKKRLHEDIGNAIEELYKENIAEHYGILAEHFISSENFGKGANFYKLAGRQAEKAGSLNDAIVFINKQVACLERLTQTDGVEKNLIDSRTILGLYHTQMGQFIKAKTSIDPIVDVAIKRNYKKRVSHIYSIIGAYKGGIEEDFSSASEYYEKSLKIGKELNDPLSLVLGNNMMGAGLSSIGEFDKALHCFEKALEINVVANSLWGIAAIKAWIAVNYHRRGDISLGYESSKEALRIADESGDIYSKGHAYTAHGSSYFYKGYIEEAKEYLLKGADFSERINMFMFAASAHFGLGMTYLNMEEYRISQKHFEKAISINRQGSLNLSYVNYNKIAFTLAKVMNDEVDIKIDDIFKWHEDIKSKWHMGWTLNCIGKILLNIGDRHNSEVEGWIKRSIETNQKYGMIWNLAQDYALYAELFKRKGDQSKAKGKLKKAIEIFKECGADGWVERYEKALLQF